MKPYKQEKIICLLVLNNTQLGILRGTIRLLNTPEICEIFHLGEIEF